jgi:hypothetical protein
MMLEIIYASMFLFSKVNCQSISILFIPTDGEKKLSALINNRTKKQLSKITDNVNLV